MALGESAVRSFRGGQTYNPASIRQAHGRWHASAVALTGYGQITDGDLWCFGCVLLLPFGHFRWSSQYGSPMHKVTEPDTEGIDTLTITGRHLDRDGTRLILDVPDLLPCHTLKLEFSVSGQEVGALEGLLYFTIHELRSNE